MRLMEQDRAVQDVINRQFALSVRLQPNTLSETYSGLPRDGHRSMRRLKAWMRFRAAPAKGI